MLQITQALPVNVHQLQQISITTFVETFAVFNTQENMDSYLRESLSISKLSAELSNKNSEFYFAMLEDEVIGYLKVNYKGSQTETLEGVTLEVERVYISAKHQGKKFGHLLLEKAMQLARGINAEFLWLAVWEKNVKAIKFYEQHKFAVFGSHTFKLGDDLQLDILMKVKL